MKHTLTIMIATAIVIAAGLLSFIISDEISMKLTGKTIAQVYVVPPPAANCTVQLYAGLNMASFWCENGITSVNDSLVDQNGAALDYEAIFKYNPLNASDSWDSYNPSLPNYTVQALTRLSMEHGYWIDMNSDGTYFKSGYAFSNINIVLKNGWNLIGYPKSSNQTINSFFGPLNTTITRIESYQYPSWYVWQNGSGNLTTLVPMAGYWVNSTSNTTLVFP